MSLVECSFFLRRIAVQARLKTQDDVVIVYLSGRVDVETAEPFRAACLREFKGKRIVFDFSGLSFVGSQGILPFLETLQAFQERAPGTFNFSGVGTEFRKVFAATPLTSVSIYESVETAILVHTSPELFQPAAAMTPTISAVEAAPISNGDFIPFRSEPAPERKTSDLFEADEDLDV
jgi:anti-anti-sigma factor